MELRVLQWQPHVTNALLDPSKMVLLVLNVILAALHVVLKVRVVASHVRMASSSEQPMEVKVSV